MFEDAPDEENATWGISFEKSPRNIASGRTRRATGRFCACFSICFGSLSETCQEIFRRFFAVLGAREPEFTSPFARAARIAARSVSISTAEELLPGGVQTWPYRMTPSGFLRMKAETMERRK